MDASTERRSDGAHAVHLLKDLGVGTRKSRHAACRRVTEDVVFANASWLGKGGVVLWWLDVAPWSDPRHKRRYAIRTTGSEDIER